MTAQVSIHAPTPIATPNQSQAIPIGTPSLGAAPEQWETFLNNPIVRNVTAATLTPVLPEPGNATGAAVIIAPGGGFMFLQMNGEGFDEAHWLADHGIAVFVLKYRPRETPRDPGEFLRSFMKMFTSTNANKPDVGEHGASSNAGPAVPSEALEDAEAAVRLVRSRAPEWHVDPNRVGFLGFSAGAMMTLSVGLTKDNASRPDFIAPIYGDMSAREVPPNAPPIFLAIALDDPLLAMGKKMGLIESWRNAHRPVEAHFYLKGGHGFGMSRTSATSGLWIDEFYAWMNDLGVLTPGRHGDLK